MNLKLQAARYAISLVESGMVLGLGTGSTSYHFVQLLGEKINSGELSDILSVPTSTATVEPPKNELIILATPNALIVFGLSV